MKDNNVNENKELIEVKQSIFKKIKKLFEDVFLGEKHKINNMKILTFEEQMLSPEEREELSLRREKDKEDAEYYKKAFENPEDFFVIPEEIDVYESDEEIEEIPRVATENKEELFSVYEAVKSGAENVDSLDIADLLKIECLLRKEISIRKVDMESSEIEMIEKELKALEEENKRLTEKLKKIEENN